jgi:hypothetical protein
MTMHEMIRLAKEYNFAHYFRYQEGLASMFLTRVLRIFVERGIFEIIFKINMLSEDQLLI